MYQDIGLAAVAIELDLIEEDLGEEMEDAIERGARYIAPLNLPLRLERTECAAKRKSGCQTKTSASQNAEVF